VRSCRAPRAAIRSSRESCGHALGGSCPTPANQRCGRGDPPGTVWLLIPLGDARSPYDSAEPRRGVTRRGSTVNPRCGLLDVTR
jgi:hypothetical protein